MHILSKMPKNQSLNHVKKFALWIWHAPDPIYGFINIIVALIYCFFLANTTQNIIICGFLLQLFGVLTALHVLRKMQNDFGQSFRNPFSNWWSLYPLRKMPPILGYGNISPKVARINGLGPPKMPNHQSGSPDERLDKISESIEILHKNEMALFESVDLIVKNQEDTSQVLVNTIEETKKELLEQMKKSLTEDIHLSMTGLLLLLVGVFISTFANYIL